MTLEDAQALAAEVADPDFLETYAELKARLRMYEEMHARLLGGLGRC